MEVRKETIFEVVYHHLVVREDIPGISKSWKDKIRKAIEKKLVTKPDLYGRPLRRSLRGYHKLRVGDYRVVFKIDGNKVKILAIKHRSVIYDEVKQRSFNPNK